MRRFILAWVLAAAAPALTGCGSDSPTQPANAVISGTYALKTVNGAQLPFVVPQTTYDKLELVSDVITAKAGAFTELSTYRVTQGGQVSTQSLSDAGSYTVNGNAASFVFQSDGSTGTATVSTSSFTVAEAGLSFYYVKQ